MEVMLRVNKMRSSSHLLPEPGGEVVRECLDEVERLNQLVQEIHWALSGVLHHATDGENWQRLLANIESRIRELSKQAERRNLRSGLFVKVDHMVLEAPVDAVAFVQTPEGRFRWLFEDDPEEEYQMKLQPKKDWRVLVMPNGRLYDYLWQKGNLLALGVDDLDRSIGNHFWDDEKEQERMVKATIDTLASG